MSPDSRAFLRWFLAAAAENTIEQTEDLCYSALFLYWLWCWNGPIFFPDGIVGVGMDCAGSRKARHEDVANIHYVCEEKITVLLSERLIGRRTR